MKEFVFQSKLWLPRQRHEIFSFFSDARNLKIITPPWLNLQILTAAPILIKAGALIDYRVRVHGLSFQWRTKITEWNPPLRFVDIQVRGPYRFWRHTHTFEEERNGTLCTDDIRYWPRGGKLLNWLFIRGDVERIFAFRSETLAQTFL
jgi:ligand-binding SRPBCC domain-containing protein